MADTDLQITLGADASGLIDGVTQATDAIGTLDQALQALTAPVQGFQSAVSSAFASTAPASEWAQGVQQACTQAATSSAATASAVQAQWKMSLDPIGSMFAKTFDSLLLGTQTFGEAFTRLGDQMLSRFLGWCVEMAERWAVKELSQTLASTAGATTRTATEAAAQATGLAASAATATADIGNSGARAAAGAYAATASVPIVGPALAPAAAATALAAVLEFGSALYSAEGGWGSVPVDGALTALHANEMVLPSRIASPLRDMLDSGASGLGGAGSGAAAAGATAGDTHHHWNISAVDARSFVKLAKDNPDAITAGLTRAVQRLGVTPASLAKGSATR
jgi:hypothetical protein